MNFVVLGGTLFLGRHLVRAAVERGHRVTTFTRGSRARCGTCGLTATRS
ncbi:MAG: NAD-dependent epimerase/dehydratase family protein [Gemmatimonadaceae bacterium]